MKHSSDFQCRNVIYFFLGTPSLKIEPQIQTFTHTQTRKLEPYAATEIPRISSERAYLAKAEQGLV